MNILLLWDINLEYIKSHLPANYQYFTDYDLIDTNIDIIVVRWSNFSLDKSYLSKFPTLRAIFVLWIWTDNIDLVYCKQKNILVSNEPTISTYSVSELTVSLLIGGLRQIFSTWLNLKEGIYSRTPMWYNLTNKTIWILGYWNIWKLTTRLLAAFKKIRTFKLAVYDKDFWQYDDFLVQENITKYTNFSDFVSNIDYLVIHIWGGADNVNLINKEILTNTSVRWIVNTARKWIVNEKDIIYLLNTNKLDFYVTDVVMGEPTSENILPELLSHHRVFITPHIWANTYQVQQDLLDSLINKIKACTKSIV